MALQIDKGRLVSSGQTIQWVDQIGGLQLNSVIAGAGPTVTTTGAQQYDLQQFGTGIGLEKASALWSNGQARTVIAVVRNPNAATVGGALGALMKFRSTAAYWTIMLGQTGGLFLIAQSGSVNVSLSPSVGASAGNSILGLSVVTYRSTPGGGGAMGYRVNGVNYPTTGVINTDTGTADLQIGFRSDVSADTFSGYIEEVYAFPTQLSDAAVTQWENYLTGKFIIPGMPGWENDSTNYTRPGTVTNVRTAYARIRLYTSATSLTMASTNQYDSVSGTGQTVGAAFTVFIDGTYNQTITIPYVFANPTVETVTLTAAALDGNPHLVEIWEGGEFDTGYQGSPILYIQDPAGKTFIYPSQPPPTNRIAWYGDSISQSALADIPLHGAVMLLRQSTSNAGIALLTGSGRSLFSDHGIDNSMQQLATWICNLATDQTSGTRLGVDMIGTNDYGGVGYSAAWTSAAAFQTAYAALLDDIHATDPGLPYLSIGPIIRGNENANNSASGTPYNLPAIRSAKSAACAARSSFCTYVDASQNYVVGSTTYPAVTLAQLNAGSQLHPLTAGHMTLFQWYQGVIQNLYPGVL